MTGDPKGTYADSRNEQVEFEEHVREEGDWQEAVDDVVEGEQPEENADTPASSGL